MKFVITCFSFAIAALVCGCASSRQYVHYPDQTLPIESPEKARIYVARPSFFGGAISMRVSDGDTVIGHTGPKGYLCWERNPGTVSVNGKSENTCTVTVDVQQGEVYYFEQSPCMGFLIARNKIKQVSDDRGKLLVEKCKPPKLENQQ